MGVFRASTSDRILMFPPGCQRVLAYLALNEAASRSELAGALWPDHPQTRAQADLRTVLWRLRRTSLAFVEVSGNVLSLQEGVDVDLDEVTDWAQSAIAPTMATAVERRTSPRSAGLELLPGWDDEWLEAPRARVRMLQIQAFESIASQLLTAGRVPEAVPFVLHVIESDPLRESAQHLLMEIHIRQGNIPEALRQYEIYRTRLRSELGIEPGLRVTSLIGQYTSRPPAGSRAGH